MACPQLQQRTSLPFRCLQAAVTPPSSLPSSRVGLNGKPRLDVVLQAWIKRCVCSLTAWPFSAAGPLLAQQVVHQYPLSVLVHAPLDPPLLPCFWTFSGHHWASFYWVWPCTQALGVVLLCPSAALTNSLSLVSCADFMNIHPILSIVYIIAQR